MNDTLDRIITPPAEPPAKPAPPIDDDELDDDDDDKRPQPKPKPRGRFRILSFADVATTLHALNNG
jgi:hypothetical protein